MHANTAGDVPARLEALAVAAGMPREALHAQLASAVQLVVHLAKGRDGGRRVAELCVLERLDNGLVRAVTAVDFGADGSATAGPGAGHLASLLGRKAPCGQP